MRIQQIKKYQRKKHIYNWFQRDAIQTNDILPLNGLSGWGKSDKIFNETIDDWMLKIKPLIKPGDKVFEMGCGVGAVLYYINNNVNDLTISGSDFSPNAIKK